MHIAILFGGLISNTSGTAERVIQIANALAVQGLDVTLSGITYSALKTQHLTDLHVIELPDNILKLHRIMNWIAKIISHGLTCKFDIVQIESFSSIRSLALFLLLRFLGRKFVIVFHDKYFRQDPRKSAIGKLTLLLQRIILANFDASIVPGLSIKKWFEELHGELATKKMIVIPNGAPTFEIKNTLDPSYVRVKHGIDSNAFVALFFGSMGFQPNYDAAFYLYKTSASISRDFEKKIGRKLIFVIAGKGSETLPKTDYYVPIGFVDELDELFALPDEIVLPHSPSYSGPHIKTTYAFLSKRPVIATDDAVKDMPNVIPGKHFLRFELNEPSTLIACLTKLYFDRELCERLALNAYLYSKQISWGSVSLMHTKLYERLLLKKDKNPYVRA